MGRRRISGFVLASIFLILMILLLIVYFSELNPNIESGQEAEEVTIKELSENVREYIGKNVKIKGTITSPEGDYMLIADEGAEFAVKNPDLSLKKGKQYELTGIVRSRPSLYYRYYTVEHYVDVREVKVL